MALFIYLAAAAGAQKLVCRQLPSLVADLRVGMPRTTLILRLERAEWSVRHQPVEERIACLKWLADLHRDVGSYRAAALYDEALELAPESPEVLEATARYYRVYRGTSGLFAQAEALYLRAEQAIEAAYAATLEPSEFLIDLREATIRGRIELNKREGLGIWIPRRPGQRLGLYLGSTVDNGRFPVAHNDLATPANTLLNLGSNFDTREMLRRQDFRRNRTRLRWRTGKRPYVDLALNTIDGTNVIASQFLPVLFADLAVEELELAIEDTVDLAPAADLLWRVEGRHGRFDVEGPARETFDRVTASTTWTRSFGRVKTDLQLLGSAAAIEHEQGGTDHDQLGAVTWRAVHFRPQHTNETRPIDPRGYEYSTGYVTRIRSFGDEVELVQETFFFGLKLTELAPRTDLEILPNFFSNRVRGKTGEDSSNLEFNAILTYRLIDRVNNLRSGQALHALGIAQWAVNLRIFEELAFDSLSDFESRGLVASSFVELFSGPANRSTMILEAAYEVRDYRHLNERQELARWGLRLGF